ncbi:hypothetical protein MGG_17427, partial [Pyricularia oryzae 70-15]
MGRVYNKSMMDQNPDIAGIGLIVPCSNAQLVHNLDRQPVSPGKLSVKSLVYKLTIVLLATSIRPIIFWTRLEFFDL